MATATPESGGFSHGGRTQERGRLASIGGACARRRSSPARDLDGGLRAKNSADSEAASASAKWAMARRSRPARRRPRHQRHPRLLQLDSQCAVVEQLDGTDLEVLGGASRTSAQLTGEAPRNRSLRATSAITSRDGMSTRCAVARTSAVLTADTFAAYLVEAPPRGRSTRRTRRRPRAPNCAAARWRGCRSGACAPAPARGRNRFLAHRRSSFRIPSRASPPCRVAADVDGEYRDRDLHGEAGHAVGEAPLVAKLDEEPPAWPERTAEALPAASEIRPKGARRGPDDEMRLRLVQRLHGEARSLRRLFPAGAIARAPLAPRSAFAGPARALPPDPHRRRSRA